MPHTVHVYVFDGYADWEPAFAMAGIRDPQFQREPGLWQVTTVGEQAGVPVRSMGGMLVTPELALNELHVRDSAMLILPGGTSWVEMPSAHRDALEAAAQFFDAGVPVAAICGATAGLARAGWLDDRPHTSNAAAYLNGTGYRGAAHYLDEPAVRDDGLITAGGMAPLEFAREIFIELGLYEDEVLEAWYQLYKTGKSEYFARMARAADDTPAASDEARQLPATEDGPHDEGAGKDTTMRNSNRPSGPGKPMQERRDSASEREEIDEMSGAQAADPSRSARQGERDAHVSERGKHTAGGKSRDRSR